MLRFVRVLSLLFIAAGFGGWGSAQEPAPVMANHSWARFGIGSWKLVRTKNETLDETGKVESSSITDTKSTLFNVTDHDYTLKVESVVEVAGKKIAADPKFVTQGFHGEANGQTVLVKELGTGEVAIAGQKYPSAIRQVVINGDELRRVSTIHSNERVSPFVLRRETQVTDAAGKTKLYDSVVEVLSVDVPYRIRSEVRPVSRLRTTLRRANGATSVTHEVHSAEIPGGIVANTAEEIGPAGRVTTRQSAEIVEFQVVTLAEEAKLPRTSANRRRLFRSRTTR